MERAEAELGTVGRDTVGFVSIMAGLGGPSRSLATVLDHAGGRVTRVLIAPEGKFTRLVFQRESVDEYLRLPRWRRFARISRLISAARIGLWVGRNRSRLLALHANGQAELNLVSPAAVIFRIPVVMWAHAYEPSPSARILGRVWRRLLPRIRYAAVSVDARQVLHESGYITRPNDVTIVPNPIDPADILATHETPHDGVNVGYLRGRGKNTGFALLPDVLHGLDRLRVKLLIFAGSPGQGAPQDQLDTWERLQPYVGTRVEMRGKIPHVNGAYAECDIVFCPSVQESFGRVAAEAMLNGIPVVATDIPALRRLVGDNEAGLLFPVGDAVAASECIGRLAGDPDLRRQLGEVGRQRASVFLPDPIVAQLHSIYVSAGAGE